MTLITLGRIVFGLFFLIAGLRNFAAFAERRGLMTNYGFALPAPLLALGFACQVIAGAMLVAGYRTGLAASALILFLAAATPLYHNFFRFRGKERDPHLYLVLVNITLAAGLLLVIATAGG